MSDWQDISTAPRDGTQFLAWNKYSERWTVNEWLEPDDNFLWAQGQFPDPNVTHWMPLPKPPEAP